MLYLPLIIPLYLPIWDPAPPLYHAVLRGPVIERPIGYWL